MLMMALMWRVGLAARIQYLDHYAEPSPFLIKSGFVHFRDCDNINVDSNASFPKTFTLSVSAADFVSCTSTTGKHAKEYYTILNTINYSPCGSSGHSCMVLDKKNELVSHMCPSFMKRWAAGDIPSSVWEYPYHTVCGKSGVIHKQNNIYELTGTLCDFPFTNATHDHLMLAGTNCSVGFQIRIKGNAIYVAQTLDVLQSTVPIEMSLAELGSSLFPSNLKTEILDITNAENPRIKIVEATTEKITVAKTKSIALHVEKLEVRSEPYKVVTIGDNETVKHWFYLRLVKNISISLNIDKSGYMEKNVSCVINDELNGQVGKNIQSIVGPLLSVWNYTSQSFENINNPAMIRQPTKLQCKFTVQSTDSCFPYKQAGNEFIFETIQSITTEELASTSVVSTLASTLSPITTEPPDVAQTKIKFATTASVEGKNSGLSNASIVTIKDKVVVYGKVVVPHLHSDNVTLVLESIVSVMRPSGPRPKRGESMSIQLVQVLKSQFKKNPETIEFMNGETNKLGGNPDGAPTESGAETGLQAAEIGPLIGGIMLLLIVVAVVGGIVANKKLHLNRSSGHVDTGSDLTETTTKKKKHKGSSTKDKTTSRRPTEKTLDSTDMKTKSRKDSQSEKAQSSFKKGDEIADEANTSYGVSDLPHAPTDQRLSVLAAKQPAAAKFTVIQKNRHVKFKEKDDKEIISMSLVDKDTTTDPDNAKKVDAKSVLLSFPKVEGHSYSEGPLKIDGHTSTGTTITMEGTTGTDGSPGTSQTIQTYQGRPKANGRRSSKAPTTPFAK